MYIYIFASACARRAWAPNGLGRALGLTLCSKFFLLTQLHEILPQQVTESALQPKPTRDAGAEPNTLD